mgnify:CR=1 FL=1
MSLISDTIRCSRRAIENFRSSGNFDYYSQKATSSAQSGYGTRGYETNMPDIDMPDINVPDASISPTFAWILVIVVMLAILSLVVYILYKQGFFDMKTKHKKEEEDDDSETEEDTDNDLKITGIDFEDEISRAKANRNWREGIRHVYLKALRNLSDKEIIIWDKEKTPTEYDYEAKIPKFSRLTNLFLRIRYGMYDASEAEFLLATLLLDEVTKTAEEKGGTP